MKLTPKEKEICKKYRARDSHRHVHCYECPLKIDEQYYMTIDGKTEEAKELKRYI